MIAALALLGVALAAPGLHTDGVVPEVGLGEGLLSGGLTFRDGEQLPYGLVTGRLGFGQEVAGELTALLSDDELTLVEGRVMLPLMGAAADPRLTLFAGGSYDLLAPDDVADPDWWVEVGLVGGSEIGDTRLRLYGGVVGNAPPTELLGWWVEPALGLSWRPALTHKLVAVVGLEGAGWIDTEVYFGRVGLMAGIAGAPAGRGR